MIMAATHQGICRMRRMATVSRMAIHKPMSIPRCIRGILAASLPLCTPAKETGCVPFAHTPGMADMAKDANTTRSMGTCIIQDQRKPFVSTMALAEIQPRKAAVRTPITPGIAP